MQYLIVLLSGLLISSAFATEVPRKIDFTQVIVDQDDEPVMDCADQPPPRDDRECKIRRPVTLGLVAMRALTIPEQGLASDIALRRGQLALSVYKSPGAELTTDEITLIKGQIAKGFGPLIVARAFPLLDPATAPK